MLYKHESDADYHAVSRSGRALSSHMLMSFLESPALYKHKVTTRDRIESRAFVIGSAAHQLILEGHLDGYVTNVPINDKTGEPYGPATKVFKEWARADGRTPLLPEEHDMIMALQRSVKNHKVASNLLAHGHAEQIHRSVVNGMPCQIKMDFISVTAGIVDLKTCSNIRWFESDIKRYQYAVQMAFYRMVYRESTGSEVPVHIVSVDKTPPHLCGVWRMSPMALDTVEIRIKSAIDQLKECWSTDTWPTGYEDVRVYHGS